MFTIKAHYYIIILRNKYRLAHYYILAVHFAPS